MYLVIWKWTRAQMTIIMWNDYSYNYSIIIRLTQYLVWKIVSLYNYIHRTWQVKFSIKNWHKKEFPTCPFHDKACKHNISGNAENELIAGTITKKNKSEFPICRWCTRNVHGFTVMSRKRIRYLDSRRFQVSLNRYAKTKQM